MSLYKSFEICDRVSLSTGLWAEEIVLAAVTTGCQAMRLRSAICRSYANGLIYRVDILTGKRATC